MKLYELVAEGMRDLYGYTDTPGLDSELIAGYTLNTTRKQMIMEREIDISHDIQIIFSKNIKERIEGKPVDKILGVREFWGRNFVVTEDTLSPRPDSEALISAILDAYIDRNVPCTMMDLGTGTGCLLISMLHEYHCALGVGLDNSAAAIEIARQNMTIHGIHEDRCNLYCLDWTLWVSDSQIDILFSNPPYLSCAELKNLNLLPYEPLNALYGGEDGLKCYREIACFAAKFLKSGGSLFLEIGHMQRDAVKAIFDSPFLMNTGEHQDYSGHIRVLSFCKK